MYCGSSSRNASWPCAADDLRVRDVAPVVDERLDDLARARRGEPPVRRERDDEEPAGRRRERAGEIAARGRGRIEIVERLGDAQVGVRVEVLGELLALVAEVGLDLELRRERELEAFAQRAAEPRLHLLVGQVRDVPDHPRDDESAPRLGAVHVEVAVVEVRVREDRLARDLVERDVLRGQVRRGGDHQRMADALRIARRPRERLHAAEAAAHHRSPLPDAEEVGESRLRVDPVLDGHERKIGAPRRPARGIRRQRTGRAEAAAEVVDADDEEAIGVERLAGADHVVPPADVFRVALVEPGDVVRRIERVTDEHRIRAVRIPACRTSRRRARIAAVPCRTRGGAARRSGRAGRRPARPSGRRTEVAAAPPVVAEKVGIGKPAATKNRPACSLTGSVSGSPLAAPL